MCVWGGVGGGAGGAVYAGHFEDGKNTNPIFFFFFCFVMREGGRGAGQGRGRGGIGRGFGAIIFICDTLY